ncbi:nitroreductase/quinone reductase family protein [Kutzneria kofuensis]|uniref:Deazaflavin-dependent oxidoreductase (Nitroreductase family) n=1 Tax=Kutzneria kofuensis TaxID=103725 RepID=A0A7W9NF86_9PSEU|nr:nitroreductase/quinone reductase family protein [Kutzneria kofuensis]MBB5890259.1 deazaflavin-dependent oxidoreductase (nitroreductase family) [Kutzneria kofuensis]
MSDMNAQIIEAFRANDGVVGGPFEGKRLLLLHHIGRKTGQERVNPLVAAKDGDAYLICGSMGGAPKDPDWVGNIEAGSGETTVEVPGETLRVRTTIVRPDGPEWERLYGIWAEYWPDAKEYETRTTRKFPMIRLTPVSTVD